MTQVVTDRGGLGAALAGARTSAATVALVPTMGALHAGHSRLLQEARERADLLVASVFVNPLQFGPAEDYTRYPRDAAADAALMAAEGVDVVFSPSVEAVYPGGPPRVSVDPGPLGTRLEGAGRPGHFCGVLTVVAVLFGLVRPQLAVFGEKDYQQLVLVRAMVHDLAMGVEVASVDTVRDSDGLAASSRNAYLDDAARTRALALSRALLAGHSAARDGAPAVLRAAQSVLAATDGLEVDYLELAAPDLGPPPSAGPARLLVAARVESTRLIDNIAVLLGVPEREA